MSFIYPVFLLAGLSLAIPVLIHLFNLRKYKTVLFPHTRFLRTVQLQSRKQSQVRYKLLLLTRLLFLAALVLAFAQPFFSGSAGTSGKDRLRIIYIDNSLSMSVKKGPRQLLDIALDCAMQQVRSARPGTHFLVLTNDKPFSFYPVTADKALAAINVITFSPASRTISQVLAQARSLSGNEGKPDADVFFYSDFQRNAFPATPAPELVKDLTVYAVPLAGDAGRDIAIDTAWLTSPVLQTGKNNQLIVRTTANMADGKEQPVLQLVVNGQVKSAASLNYSGKTQSEDTLNFSIADVSWQRMELRLSDGGLTFDDTFRIAARCAPNLSVLVYNQGQPNPFIQAAFRAYNGFRLNQVSAPGDAGPWKNYNLIILNGVTHIDPSLAGLVTDALTQGQSICIFPGRSAELKSMNSGLQQIGDISLASCDTATQTVASIQQGNSFVRELFEKIPDNVQLPVANWHYVINSGLSANRQALLSFRNGDPFLARYTPSRGSLFICASAADLAAGNFPGSYFFTPFLYQMAMQSGSSSIYALSSGSKQPVYLPLRNATERNTVHLTGNGMDMVPPQRTEGAGLDVFVDDVAQQPGFYTLAAPGTDTIVVALNAGKDEARLEYCDLAVLKSTWKGANIIWTDPTDNAVIPGTSNNGVPWWKICVVLALVALAAETFLLVRPAAAVSATA